MSSTQPSPKSLLTREEWVQVYKARHTGMTLYDIFRVIGRYPTLHAFIDAYVYHFSESEEGRAYLGL